METERFEALIDAILAIIITIIVLEIPLASNGSWQALLDIKYEFIIYAISFMICFNFWNFNNNAIHVRIDLYHNRNTFNDNLQIPEGCRSGKHCPYGCPGQFLSYVFYNRLGPNWNGDWISRISSGHNDMLPDFNFWSLDYSKA